MNNEENKIKQNRLQFDWGQTPEEEKAPEIVLETESVEPEKAEEPKKGDSVQLSNGTIPSENANHLYPLKTNLNTAVPEKKSATTTLKKEEPVEAKSQKLFHRDEESSLYIGKPLKEARKAKDYTIERVAEITRIRKDIIEFIEKDDYEKAPAPVYTRGYIRKLAELYDCDSKTFVENYNDMIEGKRRKKTVTNIPKQVKAIIDDFDSEPTPAPALTPAGVNPNMMGHTRSKGFIKKILIGSAAAIVAMIIFDTFSGKDVKDDKPKENQVAKSSVKPIIEVDDLLKYSEKVELETLTLEIPKTDIK